MWRVVAHWWRMAVGLRERKKEKTRDSLARTALRLFAKRGFDHVTVEEIAAACEVSPRTFFRYFRSKEDALFADSDARRGTLLAALAAQPAEASAFDTLEGAARTTAAEYSDHGDALRARQRVLNATASLRTRAAERQQRWDSDIIDVLRASGRAAPMSELDLRLMVATTTTALRVAVDAWVAAGGTDDLITVLDAVFATLRTGFG